MRRCAGGSGDQLTTSATISASTSSASAASGSPGSGSTMTAGSATGSGRRDVLGVVDARNVGPTVGDAVDGHRLARRRRQLRQLAQRRIPGDPQQLGSLARELGLADAADSDLDGCIEPVQAGVVGQRTQRDLGGLGVPAGR